MSLIRKLDIAQDLIWFIVISLIVGTCLILILPIMLPIWTVKWFVDKARGF